MLKELQAYRSVEEMIHNLSTNKAYEDVWPFDGHDCTCFHRQETLDRSAETLTDILRQSGVDPVLVAAQIGSDCLVYDGIQGRLVWRRKSKVCISARFHLMKAVAEALSHPR